MKSLTVLKAKNKFEMLLNWAKKEPVFIEEEGQQVVVMLSVKEYKHLSALANQLAQVKEKLTDEDSFWGEKAEKAKQEGFIGEKQSEALLEDLLDA